MNSVRLRYSALVLFGASILGCTNMARHPKSGYYELTPRSDAAQFYYEKNVEESSQAVSELGLQSKVDKDPSDYLSVGTRIQLNRLEKAIESKREKQQYYNIKPYLSSDEERIYFLSLNDYEQRAKFIRSLPVSNLNEQSTPELQEAVDTGDVVLGMTKKSVKESWGEPESVEVAGNAVYGNERWRYTRNVASENGGNKELRIIYFEGGRVAGWEKQ